MTGLSLKFILSQNLLPAAPVFFSERRVTVDAADQL